MPIYMDSFCLALAIYHLSFVDTDEVDWSTESVFLQINSTS